jgi:hypothetical protein
MIAALVTQGMATITAEKVRADGKLVAVAKVRITGAGRDALAAESQREPMAALKKAIWIPFRVPIERPTRPKKILRPCEAAVLTQQDAGEGATMEADAFGPGISTLVLLHLAYLGAVLFVGACVVMRRYYR